MRRGNAPHTSPIKEKIPTQRRDFFFGGVYWTKFECISSKILMRTTNRTRGAHGDLKLPCTLRLRGEANQCASDSLTATEALSYPRFVVVLAFAHTSHHLA